MQVSEEGIGSPSLLRVRKYTKIHKFTINTSGLRGLCRYISPKVRTGKGLLTQYKPHHVKETFAWSVKRKRQVPELATSFWPPSMICICPVDDKWPIKEKAKSSSTTSYGEIVCHSVTIGDKRRACTTALGRTTRRTQVSLTLFEFWNSKVSNSI